MSSATENGTTYVADANFILRIVDTASEHHAAALAMLKKLEAHGDNVVLAPQTLFEFYVVATRPRTARGGFGMDSQTALKWIDVLSLSMVCFPKFHFSVSGNVYLRRAKPPGLRHTIPGASL